MLKIAYFWEKTVKIVSASGIRPQTPVFLRRLGAPPPDPRVVTPAYYYNFVKFVSSAKCILFRSEKNQVTTANVFVFASSGLLHLFFNSNSVSFLDVAQEYFLPQSAGYPSYATVSTVLCFHACRINQLTRSASQPISALLSSTNQRRFVNVTFFQ